MGNSATLLPPNATRLETALAMALARVSDIPLPLAPLWNPATCPLPLLPWLAYGLSTDQWRQEWTEARKREAVAQAIPTAKIKGSRAASDAVLADYDPLLTLTEWFEEGGSGIPFTYTVTLPIDGAGGARSTAAFARELYRDLVSVKPARAHFALRQSVPARAAFGGIGAGRALRSDRFAAGMVDPSPADDLKITTEYGEPIEGADGLPLEYA